MAKWWWHDDDDAAAVDVAEVWRAGGCSSASSWVAWGLTRNDNEDMAKWWWPDDDDAAAVDVGAVFSWGGTVAALVDEEGAAGWWAVAVASYTKAGRLPSWAINWRPAASVA